MTAPNLATVTLNPALDLTGMLPSLTVGEVNRITHSDIRAAGKGVNVAMVARDLGAKVSALGVLGEANQDPFVALFAQKGIDDQFVRVSGETRINIKLGEDSGNTTDLNFPGFVVSESAQQQLLNAVTRSAAHHALFVLAGSLPDSLPSTMWQQLIRVLTEQGKQVLLDTSGTPLRDALSDCTAMPHMIKPNEHELSELVGYECLTAKAQKAAANQLIEKGVNHVVVSNGKRGVSWYWQGGQLHAKAPEQQVISSVGAGDSLLAGIAVGLAKGMATDECLRLGVAVSALAVTQIAVGVRDEAEREQLAQQVVLSDTPLF